MSATGAHASIDYLGRRTTDRRDGVLYRADVGLMEMAEGLRGLR